MKTFTVQSEEGDKNDDGSMDIRFAVDCESNATKNEKGERISTSVVCFIGCQGVYKQYATTQSDLDSRVARRHNELCTVASMPLTRGEMGNAMLAILLSR